MCRYLSELAHPYYKLSPHYEIVVASPAAGEAPLDEGSVSANKEDPKSMKFLGEKEELWKNTEKLESFKGQTGQFAAIFFVGGHGRESYIFFLSSLLRLSSVMHSAFLRYLLRSTSSVKPGADVYGVKPSQSHYKAYEYDWNEKLTLAQPCSI